MDIPYAYISCSCAIKINRIFLRKKYELDFYSIIGDKTMINLFFKNKTGVKKLHCPFRVVLNKKSNQVGNTTIGLYW